MDLNDDHQWMLKPLGKRLMQNCTMEDKADIPLNAVTDFSITKGTPRYYIYHDVMQQKVNNTMNILAKKKLNFN